MKRKICSPIRVRGRSMWLSRSSHQNDCLFCGIDRVFLGTRSSSRSDALFTDPHSPRTQMFPTILLFLIKRLQNKILTMLDFAKCIERFWTKIWCVYFLFITLPVSFLVEHKILMNLSVSCHFLREFPSLESVRRMKVPWLGLHGELTTQMAQIKFNYGAFQLQDLISSFSNRWRRSPGKNCKPQIWCELTLGLMKFMAGPAGLNWLRKCLQLPFHFASWQAWL